jgi:hypothetical protein
MSSALADAGRHPLVLAIPRPFRVAWRKNPDPAPRAPFPNNARRNARILCAFHFETAISKSSDSAEVSLFSIDRSQIRPLAFSKLLMKVPAQPGKLTVAVGPKSLGRLQLVGLKVTAVRRPAEVKQP